MANELSLPASFGKLPKAFAGAPTKNEELSAGVAASYAVMSYRGKVWRLKWSGEEQDLMREDGDGPRHSIEVVIVKANPAISKIFYRDGYEPGQNSPPDCWSSNGIAPDASVVNKVNPTCGNCPMNAWGSRQTDAGKPAKACSDSRRTAIVPLNDMDNDLYGGPMLLRIPPASLKDLKAYGDLLGSYNFPYYAAATRIAFNAEEAFPKFEFTALRPLTEDEAAKVIELRNDKRVSTVLAETVETTTQGVTIEAEAPVKAKSPFEQAPVTEAGKGGQKPASAPEPKPAAKATTPKPAPKAAAKPNGAVTPPKAEQAPAPTEATPAAGTVRATPEQVLKQKIEAARAKAKAAADAAAAELAALEAQAEVPEEEAVEEEETGSMFAPDEDEEGQEEVTSESNGEAPAGFDAMLDGLLR